MKPRTPPSTSFVESSKLVWIAAAKFKRALHFSNIEAELHPTVGSDGDANATTVRRFRRHNAQIVSKSELPVGTIRAMGP